jgi:hypothetical protein
MIDACGKTKLVGQLDKPRIVMLQKHWKEWNGAFFLLLQLKE